MNKKEIRSRVKALMANMTTEEKVMQLTCVMPADMTKPETMGIENGIGAMPVMGGAPNEIAENITRIQQYVLEHSRHKIPVLFHCEALAGTFIGGSCQFPLPISLGATFAPELVEEMAVINQRQMQAVGIRHVIILVNSLVPAIVGLIGFVTILMCKMEKDIKEMETARLAE